MSIMCGETPGLILELDANLTGKTVYVRIKQLQTVIDLSGERLGIVYGNDVTVITAKLTQAETLRLRPGQADIQVHWIGPDGDAPLTNICQITVRRSLWSEVIEFA